MQNCKFCLGADIHITAKSLLSNKATSVTMGSLAHTDTGGCSALQLLSQLRSQTYDGALQATAWDMQPSQVLHLVCMGSATHKNLICQLHGLCSQHEFYLHFYRGSAAHLISCNPWDCSQACGISSNFAVGAFLLFPMKGGCQFHGIGFYDLALLAS